MGDGILRLGILGCADIVTNAIISPLKEIDGIVAFGIASREKARAEACASRYGIPRAFGSYDELLRCDEIDFIYITLPNALHLEWLVAAARAGKHILVEKPMCLNSSNFQLIETVCRENRVHVMEALMVRHHPWQQRLAELVASKRLGELKAIHTWICQIPKDNFRGNYRSVREMGGGAFLDVACYWLQCVQTVIGFDDIVEYHGESDFAGPGGCDWTFRAILRFAGGSEAVFTSSFEQPYQSNHLLEFTHGRITVRDFFRACQGNFKINLQLEDRRTEVKEKIGFEPQCYYTNQLRFFSDVLRGKRDAVDLVTSFERIRLQEEIYRKAAHMTPPRDLSLSDRRHGRTE